MVLGKKDMCEKAPHRSHFKRPILMHERREEEKIITITTKTPATERTMSNPEIE